MTLPVHCAHCGKLVTVEYRPYRGLGDALETDNEYVCPHCSETVTIRLRGPLDRLVAGPSNRPTPRLADMWAVTETAFARNTAGAPVR